MTTKIYCDEAGFTGNNLLDEGQQHFVYASVAADPSEATALVLDTMKRFYIQGGELKSKLLVQHQQGQEAMEVILKHYIPAVKLIAWEKKFALASHFFENIFEPVLAEKSSIFYDQGFQLFVSAILYYEFVFKSTSAEIAFEEFHNLMRAKDPSRVSALGSALELHGNVSPPMHKILTFAACHHETIERGIADLHGLGAVERWVLDLTFSSLWKLLTHWGESVGELEVYCDDSKPLKDYKPVIDQMVGRTETAYVSLAGERQPVTFNLSKPVEIGNSKLHAGLQVADVVAGAAAFCLNNPEDPRAQKWTEMFKAAETNMIAASPRLIDLRTRDAFINAGILTELVDRTLQQQNLFNGMRRFILGLAIMYDEMLANGELHHLTGNPDSEA